MKKRGGWRDNLLAGLIGTLVLHYMDCSYKVLIRYHLLHDMKYSYTSLFQIALKIVEQLLLRTIIVKNNYC